jgi:hypothetical protein
MKSLDVPALPPIFHTPVKFAPLPLKLPMKLPLKLLALLLKITALP